MSVFPLASFPNSSVFRDIRSHNTNSSISNKIPLYSSAALPPASPASKGQIVYDTTKNQFCFCNGSAWICLSASSGSTAGIVNCTVGSSSNPNADYNSVQAALDAGCHNIRIIDGLVGGEVPGYVEPSAVDFSAVGSPIMVYLGPGVDWVLRQSLVGTGGINMIGSTVTFRGSGFSSIMSQVQDGGTPASVFSLDDSSVIQWMDTTFTTSATAVAFPVPMGRLIWRNSQYVLIGSSLTPYSFTTTGNSSGNIIEFHECTFVAPNTTSRVLDNFDAGNNGSLTLTNCTHRGSALDPTTDVTYRFDTTGGQVNVSGFDIYSTDPLSVSLGGALSSYNSVHQYGTGAVTAIMEGTPHLNNGRFDTMIFAGDSNKISNVEITGSTSTDVSSSNQLNNCNMTDSLVIDGSGNKILGCDVGGMTDLGLSVASNNNIIEKCNLVGDVTLGSGADSTNNSLSANQINGNVLVGGTGLTTGNLLNGNMIESSSGTPTLTIGSLGGGISQNCVVNNNHVEGLLTVNNSAGSVETDNCVFSGNRLIGGIAALVDSTSGSQPLFTGNIISGGGATTTVTNGHSAGVTNSSP